jgi:hypothetical protein
MKTSTPALLLFMLTFLCEPLGAENLNLRTGGFFSQGFLLSDRYNFFTDSEDGSFEFREAAVQAAIFPFARTMLSGQIFAYQLGEFGGFEPSLDYLFIEHEWNEHFGLRVGRIRRPEGIFNEVLDLDATRTFVLLPSGVYQNQFRDIYASIDGFALYGKADAGFLGRVSYELYGGDIHVDNDSSLSLFFQRTLEQGLGPTTDFSLSPLRMYGGLLAVEPFEGLRLGYSFSWVTEYELSANVLALGGRRFTNLLEIQRNQMFAEYFWNRLVLRAEYRHNQQKALETRIDNVSANAGIGDSWSDGWYVSAEFLANPKIALGAYYSELRVDYGELPTVRGTVVAPSNGGRTRNLALSVRFNPTDWWILKLEVHAFRGTSVLPSLDGSNPDLSEPDWYLLAAKTTFLF